MQASLLSSITVFAKLADEGTDLRSVLSEFVKSLFPFEKIISVDSTEATALLVKHFDFEIPEAVVKTCLNGLSKSGFVDKEAGRYNIKDKNYRAGQFQDALENASLDQTLIEDSLAAYMELIKQGPINAETKARLLKAFRAHLLGESISDEYFPIINGFIIDKSTNDNFVKILNQIKEGLILVTGLRHTSDLTAIGRWNDDITFYLDTEILFHCGGLNGELFQKAFNDFLRLVRDANKQAGKVVIRLRYFDETKDEVDRFFDTAVRIVRGEASYPAYNDAMISICKGCNGKSDVLRKRASLDAMLQSAEIELQKELQYYSRPEFNIEDAELIKKYESPQHPEEAIHIVLRNFTKINFLRYGTNNVSFERCRHMMITGKSLARNMSMDLEIKANNRDVPFASDLDFVTNRLWFRLNKGFGQTNRLPESLGFVAKAQIAMSSLLKKSLFAKFTELRKDVAAGKLSEEAANEYYNNLRTHARKPEEIKPDTLTDTMDFILKDTLDSYARTQSLLKEKAERGERAVKELRSRNFAELVKRRKGWKRTLMVWCIFQNMLVGGLVLALMILTFVAIARLRSEGDTTLSLIQLIGSLAALALSAWKWTRLKERILKWRRNKYRMIGSRQ